MSTVCRGASFVKTTETDLTRLSGGGRYDGGKCETLTQQESMGEMAGKKTGKIGLPQFLGVEGLGVACLF